MLIVIKLGGSRIDSPEKVQTIAGKVASIIRKGARVVLVHGAGRDIDRRLEMAGIPTRKVNGHRITDERSLQVVAGTLLSKNAEIRAALGSAGIRTKGMHLGMLAYVDKRAPVMTPGGEVDLGLVGRITGARESGMSLLRGALDTGDVPVICPIYLVQGECLNVNADEVCGFVSGAMHADRMIYLSDVPGVLTRDGALVERLTPEDVPLLAGHLSGGMIPKVDACIHALKRGAGSAVITDDLTAEPTGTLVTMDELHPDRSPTGETIMNMHPDGHPDAERRYAPMYALRGV